MFNFWTPKVTSKTLRIYKWTQSLFLHLRFRSHFQFFRHLENVAEGYIFHLLTFEHQPASGFYLKMPNCSVPLSHFFKVYVIFDIAPGHRRYFDLLNKISLTHSVFQLLNCASWILPLPGFSALYIFFSAVLTSFKPQSFLPALHHKHY